MLVYDNELRPRAGRWPSRAALAAHMLEKHGRDINEPRLPPLPFRTPDSRPVVLKNEECRALHRALHNPDAGPDHEH